MRFLPTLVLGFVLSSLLAACGGGGGGGGGGGVASETTFVHLTTAANRFSGGGGSLTWTVIDHPAVNNDPAAKLIVTPWRTGGTTANPSPIDVGYDVLSGRWSIANELAAVPLAIGTAFTVTVAPDAFTHLAVVGDAINPATTEIAAPSLDNQPNAVFFVTRNHTPIGAPSLALPPVSWGVTYFPPAGPLPGRWAIQAEDGAFVLAGYAWNVLVRSNAPTALRHTALPANTGAGVGLDPSETQTILVDSPLGMHVLHVRPLIAPIPLLTPPGAVTSGALMNVFHQDGSAVPIGEQFFVWRP